MSDPQGLDVTALQLNHQTSIGAGNRTVRNLVFTYSVGPHGPFTDSVPDTGNATVDGPAIQAIINNRVQLLRTLVAPAITG